MTYNGWSNYQTWAIALWLNNDEYSQEYARELVKNYEGDYEAADALEEWIEEDNPLAGTYSMFSDIMRYALGQVGWIEIVRNFREE